MQAPTDLRFQAAVERPLSLAFRNPDGAWECRDCTVTVVAERAGLDGSDVVMDFRVLDAALDAALEPMRGRGLQGPGTDATVDSTMGSPLDAAMDVARKIAEAVAPSIPPPAALVAVSLHDGAGRRVTLKR